LADASPIEGSGQGADTRPAASPLAKRVDFKLGTATIRPSRRTIEGPSGVAAVEPRVMRVLVALADANGAVLTREDLLRLCWDGVVVGEDAIHRAIAEARRAAKRTSADYIIETIPRIGYRLTPGTPTKVASRPNRRLLLGAGGVGVAALAGVAAVPLLHRGVEPKFKALLEIARQRLRLELPTGDQGVPALQQAVRLEPGNAEAWGLLALAWRNVAENAPPDATAAAAEASEQAAKRALALDLREGNALAALAVLRPYFGDWLGAEARLLDVLKVAPDNASALSHLVTLLQSTGRTAVSWKWNDRAEKLDPLSPIPQFRRALKLWMMNRVPAADVAIERALQLWPRHPGVWNARLMIFAFTGRAQAARAMIHDAQARPQGFGTAALENWEVSLRALTTRVRADVERARDANTTAAVRSPGYAVNAIMTLSMVGELDAAFAVAEGYLLRRGPLIGSNWTGAGQMPVNDQHWRRTMMLFTPAAAAMRSEGRFLALCRDVGMVDYWRAHRIAPTDVIDGVPTRASLEAI
jgi:DNA-binding winged helix-turn-helix (wHTH) protein/tetratricopeptide (TPR) repeat protein